ncbi:MAG: DUF3108 domain-containing protein [Gemmatimonadota bacterium]|jgi:hypothetical protein
MTGPFRKVVLAVAALAISAFPSRAQSAISVPESLSVSSDSVEFMEVPFDFGEEFLYEVKFGWWKVGEGFLRVRDDLEEVRGSPTYHVEMGLEGSSAGTSIEYYFHSWMDVRNLASRRYIQDQRGFNARFREYDIFPEGRRWERVGVDQEGDTPSEVPLDQVSFIWFVRTLPLEVGDEYVLNHYFKTEDNPVIIRVLRRETIEVPAGTFQCVVVEPIIKTSGLFGDGGQAEIYFTDDEARQMVYMKSRVKLLPDIHLRLKEIR